jgi:predicted DNA-binding transcriptional regulator AlpA
MMAMIVSRTKICEAYGMGKDLFYQLIEEKAPIVKIGNQFVTHSDEFDEWLRRRVKNQAAEAEAALEGMKK